MSARRVVAGGAALAVVLLLSGCTYDHLQHTDRVSLRAGNAVRANMAIQTINPTSAAHYQTSGLGKNGNVIPAPTPVAQP